MPPPAPERQPEAPRLGLPKTTGGRVTLAGVVGVAVATALGVAIPADESGRKVKANVDPVTTELRVTHVSGPQYLRVYIDIAGVPTACDGLTRDAAGRPMRAGLTFSEAQCAEMLERALVAHAQGVMRCSPGLALSRDPAVERAREGPRFAAVSLAYNIGVTAYCGSTAARKFNAGLYAQGCDALLKWNKATVRGVLQPVQGLTNRRNRERRVCLYGLGASHAN